MCHLVIEPVKKTSTVHRPIAPGPGIWCLLTYMDRWGLEHPRPVGCKELPI